MTVEQNILQRNFHHLNEGLHYIYFFSSASMFSGPCLAIPFKCVAQAISNLIVYFSRDPLSASLLSVYFRFRLQNLPKLIVRILFSRQIAGSTAFASIVEFFLASFEISPMIFPRIVLLYLFTVMFPNFNNLSMILMLLLFRFLFVQLMLLVDQAQVSLQMKTN